MTLHDFLLFSALAAVMAVVINLFVRRYWLAMLVSAAVSSFVNVAHEIVIQNFVVRPSDLVAWLPMLFVYGIVVAAPVVAIVGIPFYVIRRSRKTNPV